MHHVDRLSAQLNRASKRPCPLSLNKPDSEYERKNMLCFLAASADLHVGTAKVLSDEARHKIESQKAKMASAEEAPSITPQQTADLMRQLIDILQPGENVTRALKRLRPQHAPSAKKGERCNNRSHHLINALR